MTALSRRDFLECLAAAYGMTMIGSRQGDQFAREVVCIHIFHPAEFVPAPLMEKTKRLSTREPTEEYFGVGLPEVVICTTQVRLLDLFQYFWPFSRDDLARLQQSIEIRYSGPVIRGTPDVDDCAKYLREHRSELAQGLASSAVIFTLNEFTRHWSSEVIAASRQAGVHEFVLFKDPTRPPYLCDYPAKQKGFKRPPP